MSKTFAIDQSPRSVRIVQISGSRTHGYVALGDDGVVYVYERGAKGNDVRWGWVPLSMALCTGSPERRNDGDPEHGGETCPLHEVRA